MYAKCRQPHDGGAVGRRPRCHHQATASKMVNHVVYGLRAASSMSAWGSVGRKTAHNVGH